MGDDPTKDALEALREIEERGVKVSRQSWAKAAGVDVDSSVLYSKHSDKTSVTADVLARRLRDLAKPIKVNMHAYGLDCTGLSERLRDSVFKSTGIKLRTNEIKIEQPLHTHDCVTVVVDTARLMRTQANANGDVFPLPSLREQMMAAGRRWLARKRRQQ